MLNGVGRPADADSVQEAVLEVAGRIGEHDAEGHGPPRRQGNLRQAEVLVDGAVDAQVEGGERHERDGRVGREGTVFATQNFSTCQ